MVGHVIVVGDRAEFAGEDLNLSPFEDLVPWGSSAESGFFTVRPLVFLFDEGHGSHVGLEAHPPSCREAGRLRDSHKQSASSRSLASLRKPYETRVSSLLGDGTSRVYLRDCGVSRTFSPLAEKSGQPSLTVQTALLSNLSLAELEYVQGTSVTLSFIPNSH